MIRAKPHVESLSPYVAPLEGRRGKLRLDFNENTVGPSPKVIEAIRALGPEAYATYPEYAGLEARYAAELGVPAESVGAFNGVDAAIRAIFDAYGEPTAPFLTTAPTFGYYAPCATQQGMQIVSVPYEGQALAFPLEAFRARLGDRAAPVRLCFICNPNNPTTTLLPADEVLALARISPETLVVVDELYADFTGVSVLPQALELPNVVVLRSLSKSRGLAGLRLGFAIGPEPIIERLGRVTGPYDINALAVTAAHVCIAEREHTLRYVEEVRRAKAFAVEELRARGLRVHAEGGNFALVWPPGALAEVVERLDAAGVLVRSMAGKPLIDGSFRLTIGTRDQMRTFLEALDAALGAAPQDSSRSG